MSSPIIAVCPGSRTAKKLAALVEHGTIRDALCEAEIDEPVQVAPFPIITICLDLSTGHVNKSRTEPPDFGGLRSCSHEHGWVVFVPDSAEDPADFGCPAWFKPILLLAWRWNALLINFDSDGPHHLDLIVYSW